MSAVNEMNVKSAISSIKYVDLSDRTIVGLANLTNGVEIVESFSFRKLERVNKAIAQEIIKERIHHKVFELIGGKVEVAATPKLEVKTQTARKPGRPPKNAPAPVVLPDEDDDDDDNEAFNG